MLFVKTHPVAALQVSVVQGLLSSHVTGAPPQTPPEQMSPVVQALPSLHAFALFVKTHPVAGSQLSVVQTLPSSQTIGVPGAHAPPEQASPVVHVFPSLQGLVLFAKMQPSAASQLSVVQGLPSSQTTAAPPTQWLAPSQVSGAPAVPVHEFPSLQSVPGNDGVYEQAHALFSSAESSVHGLPSSHSEWPTQAPRPSHASEVVHESPSSQPVPAAAGAETQNRTGSHESVVHGLPSSQRSPSWLESKTQPVAGLQESAVHRLWSSQGEVSPTHWP